MSEENQQPPIGAPPPNWSEAMQGKVNNAKRAQQSKRIFLVMSLIFFGMFMWLYIIYNMSHSKQSSEKPEATVPVAAAPQAGAPVAVPVQQSYAPAQFGMPRNLAGSTAMQQPMAMPMQQPMAMPMQQPMAMPMQQPMAMPMQQPQQPMMGYQPNPYGMPGSQPMRHQGAAAQRCRTVVSR